MTWKVWARTKDTHFQSTLADRGINQSDVLSWYLRHGCTTSVLDSSNCFGQTVS